ncbi:MAG: helix-turn-helix transcriptional regulator [Burkholderiales bacterium]|nr:helix-turn-helix transcriptional regulator [Anaerolineae bacterium]
MTEIKRSIYIERIRIARGYIDHHYDAPITLEHVSDAAGYSRYHFIRLFRAVYKQTPHQYLVLRRIKRAKELLRSSDMPITDICVQVGFESLGSFSTLFRRMVGLAPGAYRSSARPEPAPAADVSPAFFIPLCFRIEHGIKDDE